MGRRGKSRKAKSDGRFATAIFLRSQDEDEGDLDAIFLRVACRFFFEKCGENVLPKCAGGEINRAKSSVVEGTDVGPAG